MTRKEAIERDICDFLDTMPTIEVTNTTKTMQETKIIVNRPEQKGIWMYSANGIICSNCGYKLETETTGLLSHCPRCSANMEEEKG